jgi:hypothetical protein
MVVHEFPSKNIIGPKPHCYPMALTARLKPRPFKAPRTILEL